MIKRVAHNIVSVPRMFFLPQPHCTEMEETEIFNFILSMYKSSCNLMLTIPATHVPLQAGREPLEIVERCCTRMVLDVCNGTEVSINLET
jgi:hypothetical protein